jgi:hypothetical protein
VRAHSRFGILTAALAAAVPLTLLPAVLLLWPDAGATVPPLLSITPTAGPVGTFVTVQYGPAANGCGSPMFESAAGSSGGFQFVTKGPQDHGVLSFLVPRTLASPSLPQVGNFAPVVPGAYQFVLTCDTSNIPATALSVSVPFTVTAPVPHFVALATSSVGSGYWLARSDGDVVNYGSAGAFGSLASQGVVPFEPVVGLAPTHDDLGYWLVAADGGVFSYGDAHFYGSIGGEVLNAPVVGMAATPDGKGYWLVASDGGVFNYGDAAFYGSMGGKPLSEPIVGIAPTADGKGYWLVGSDGGVFSFGDAVFHGSLGGTPLNQPIVGISPDDVTGGYWLVASDGGVFALGAPYLGSMGGLPLNAPITAIAATPSSLGYRLVAADGGVFDLGDAHFLGAPA